MSTRATYRITTGNGVLTFYIHHDGYLSGACRYFENMVEYENKRGDARDCFFRANENAEITTYGSHGDIEFHYNYNEAVNILTVRSISFKGTETVVFNDSLAVFLNQYTQEYDNGYFKSKKKFVDYRGLTYNKDKLQRMYSDCMDSACRQFLSGMTGNASSSLSEAKTISSYLYDIHQESLLRLEKLINEAFKH